MSNKLNMAAAVARIGSHMVWERVSNMRPTRLPAIPPSFKAITRGWLTDALCGNVVGAKIIDFTLGGASSGSTSRCFINLKYNDAGTAAVLPQRIFAKASPKFTSRVVGLSGIYKTEVKFWRKVRPLLDIEAPLAYFAGHHEASQRSIMLLREMSDCTFTNPTMYINRAEAEDMAALLARLHSTFWNSARFSQDMQWLRSSLQIQQDMNAMIGFEECCNVGIDRSSQVIPGKILKHRNELWPSFMRSLERNTHGDQTLLHYDVHIGNWYKTPAGRMGLTDWQTLVIGNWACDFAYAMTCALTIEDRRAWEKDLIRLYLDKLQAFGVADIPSFDAAWLLYRQQQFHGFAFWVFTIGRGALQPQMQPDEYSLINIERFSSAMEDLDSIGSLQ